MPKKKKEDLLISRELYIKSGIHVGSKRKNKKMAKFIYRIRPDGVAIMDIEKIDKRIRLAAQLLAKMNNVLVVGRKPAAKKAVKKFAETVGFKYIIERFMPGTLTNPKYEKYMEPDIVLITDPVIDEQAMEEAIKSNIPIIAICDTHTNPDYVDLIIPANNRSRKSLAVVYWLLAREILLLKGKIKKSSEFKLTPVDFFK